MPKFSENFSLPVLDHGYVKYIDSMGDDNSMLVAARMSTSTPTGVNDEKDNKLRTRLWKDQHTSPFEMAELCIEMQLPLFVMRQIDRHRTLDYDEDSFVESVDDVSRKYMNRNEFSGRYSVMPDLFYIPSADRIQAQSKLNKQSSGEQLDQKTRENMVKVISDATYQAHSSYKQLIARVVLPQNQYTKVQIKGSLLSWLKFLKLRLPEDVQWETREYANRIAQIVKLLWPKTWEVFSTETLNTTTLTADQLRAVTWLINKAEGQALTWEPEDQEAYDTVKKALKLT
jgi:thymidylate synthase (FAD)